MVIDLTRRPIFINTDVCTDCIVVRTARTREVDGILRRKLDARQHVPRRGNEKRVGTMAEVTPEAEMAQGDITFMEVRLPTAHVSSRQPKDALPDPYEVATYYRDLFTNKIGTWRAQLIVELSSNKNGKVWLITVRDETLKVDIVCATAKDFARPVTGQELLPLQRGNPRLAPGRGTTSVWERLRERRLLGYDTEDPLS